eukprot:TRINITY_DN6752_c0_g1_i2.p4 TRINITY_DN6752_c0_g1~~TRINITY_DN6752_c0_g1_i2.p4  ORF type:complete len:127 (-),score=3.68 TRINITY_DN6752_c0_g1_i2:203-583(-)
MPAEGARDCFDSTQECVHVQLFIFDVVVAAFVEPRKCFQIGVQQRWRFAFLKVSQAPEAIAQARRQVCMAQIAGEADSMRILHSQPGAQPRTAAKWRCDICLVLIWSACAVSQSMPCIVGHVVQSF